MTKLLGTLKFHTNYLHDGTLLTHYINNMLGRTLLK